MIDRNTHLVLYRTFSTSADAGGKRVAVFPDAAGDLQARAAASGEPLSVFVADASGADVRLLVFTPLQEKRSSDSAAVAALTWLSSTRPVSDLMQVEMSGETVTAQLCGGEWLLRQGVVVVEGIEGDLSALGLGARRAWTARTERPNLVVDVESLDDLDAFQADMEAVAAVNRATGTTGLIVFTMGGPPRADVSFRAFGPLKGFTEDAASSNMLACLVGVLGHLGRLPDDTNLLRAAQRMPGAPSRLTAQFDVTGQGVDVWVGGAAKALDTPTVSSDTDG